MSTKNVAAAAEPGDMAEKMRLVVGALAMLTAANVIDERDSLDVAGWVAWYDAAIPQVRSIKILAGAMEIEMIRRRGERVIAEGERRGGDSKVTHCVTLLPTAKTTERSRDRAIAAQPERLTAFVQHEIAAGRVPSVRGALKAVKAAVVKAKQTDRKQSQFVARQTRVHQHSADLITEIEAVADGQRRTDDQLTAAGIVVQNFFKYIRLIPWLAIDRTPAGTTFVIDYDLRAICDGRAARPAIGKSIRAYLHDLRAEITRRRKENHDDFRKRNWNSELILKREQANLLDWIEEQLNQVPN